MLGQPISQEQMDTVVEVRNVMALTNIAIRMDNTPVADYPLVAKRLLRASLMTLAYNKDNPDMPRPSDVVRKEAIALVNGIMDFIQTQENAVISNMLGGDITNTPQ